MANAATVTQTSFSEVRAKMCPSDQSGSAGCANYVEYSDKGDFGFYLLRLDSSDELIELYSIGQYNVSMSERNTRQIRTYVFDVIPEYFSKLKFVINFVVLGSKPLLLQNNTMNVEEINLEVMKFDLVQRHVSKMITTDGLCHRMFPKALMASNTGVIDWIKLVNDLLDERMPENSRSVMTNIMGIVCDKKNKKKKNKNKKNKNNRMCEISTFSDFFIGVFIKRYKKVGNVNVSTKLMIFALTCLLLADEAEKSHLITAIYNWIALSGCDSCIEKILIDYMQEKHPEKKDLSYEYGNISSATCRLIEFDVNFGYRIYDCHKDGKNVDGNYMPAATSVIPVYSHSALIISGKKSRVKVLFGKVEVILGFHVGVSLIRVINLFACAMRDSHFRRRNDILYKQMVELAREATNNGHEGNFIDNLIMDLCEIYFYFPLLQDLAKRLIFVLFYAAIPQSVLAAFNFTGNDYYGSALTSLLNANWMIFEKSDLKMLLHHGLDTGYIRSILTRPERMNILSDLY